MPKFVPLFTMLLGLSLGTAGLAYAQSPGPGQPSAQQGGMGGPPVQSMPMPGRMQQGQDGMMQGGCPMMRRMAQMEERLRRLEEQSGTPTSPAQPGTPPG